MKLEQFTLTPREIVHELDRYIIGQHEAKRAVAIALRNRWRRSQLQEDLQAEVTPKNILMIGPTGVGKTEIARRLAKLAGAPFIKVEATKFTEVGYVGRDVESIIRDLMDIAVKMKREEAMNGVNSQASEAAEERVLDALLPPPPPSSSPRGGFAGKAQEDEEANESETTEKEESSTKETATRQLFRKKLREGEFNNKEIEIDFKSGAANLEIMGPPGMEEMVGQLQNIMQSMSEKRTKRRRVKVKDALKQLTEEEAEKRINPDEIRQAALEAVEQNGIVFIDEIDKIVRREESRGGADVSREGVQRDLLPLVEGSTVFTKYGMIKTDHILFVASGAFHLAKPSDLIPELQGRLPIRVELKALKKEDLIRILTEPDASLTLQYRKLLETEGFTLEFSEDGVAQLAEIAQQVNEKAENIGARRLHTVLERLLEEISFGAADQNGEKKIIDAAYVNQQLGELVEDEDLRESIL